MLFSCAIYVSSGLWSVAYRVACAARAQPSVAVVDTFSDPAYARSSVKIVGEGLPLLAAATAAISQALELVDLADEPHPAPHPRQGAVDMVAFMPLSHDSEAALETQLSTCDALAWNLGAVVGDASPVLMFGKRAGRTLLQTRRATSFFASTKADSPRETSTSLPLDFAPAGSGPLPPNRGVSIVGAMPYVCNFNVQVTGVSLDDARAAASAVRAGFGVQVMALPYGSASCEIGVNLQASASAAAPAQPAVLECITRALPAESRVLRNYIVGLDPAEAARRGAEVLASGAASTVGGAVVPSGSFSPERAARLSAARGFDPKYEK